MEELEVFSKLEEISAVTQYGDLFGDDAEKAKQIANHKAWLQSIRHERPSTTHPYKIGVYIRYFNQTKYDNYLTYHKKQFADTVALCPEWELVDFYVDSGASFICCSHWDHLLQGRSAAYFVFSRYSRFQGESVRGGEPETACVTNGHNTPLDVGYLS